MQPHDVSLYCWSLAGGSTASWSDTDNCLSSHERARISRLATPVLQRRALLARQGLRLILGSTLDLPPAQVPLTTDERGKPIVCGLEDDVTFNLAHTGDMAILAVAHGFAVGIDIEDRYTRIDALEALAFLAVDDVAPDDATRLALWVRKEAVLKCYGSGLFVDPRNLRIVRRDARTPVRHDVVAPAFLDGITVCDIDVGSRHVAAVAVSGEIGHLVWRTNSSLRPTILVEEVASCA
jgi:4'-phosphopantetheinyl transferase